MAGTTLKTIARWLPQIDRLVRSRDDLSTHNDNLSREIERLRPQIDGLVRSRDDLSTHNDNLSREIEFLRAQNDHLVRSRDDLSRHNDHLSREIEYLWRQIANGRPKIELHDRRSLLLQHLNLDGLGLEIGPSYNPVLPKSEGYRIETIDHADANTLREKYRPLVDDVSRIEEVDYVSSGNSILETVGKPGHYDYIIASHVIEHVPDFVGFLDDCAQLLKPNGRLSLAIPDKRYCFDVFQPLTSTGVVLETHLHGARRPSPGLLFDFVANSGKRGDDISWFPDNTSEVHFINDIGEAKKIFERAQRSEEYIDAHVWRFVPSSFRLILSDLNALGEVLLRELSFTAPGGHEFFMILSRDGTGCQSDRLILAKQIAAEQAVVIFP